MALVEYIMFQEFRRHFEFVGREGNDRERGGEDRGEMGEEGAGAAYWGGEMGRGGRRG